MNVTDVWWAAAYHEAGHAVAAWYVGRSVKFVSIIPDDEAIGRVRTIRPDWFRPDLNSDRRHEKFIVGEVTHTLAGAPAEGRYRLQADPKEAEAIALELTADLEQTNALLAGDGPYQYYAIPEGGAEDRSVALDLAFYMTASTNEAMALVNWLGLRAEAIVCDPVGWSAVEAVAAALIEHRELNGRRLRAIIRAAIGKAIPSRRAGRMGHYWDFDDGPEMGIRER